MFKKSIHYNTRKIHRYLGLFIGVQFFLWTLGGLYFSWNNMNDVRGTLYRKENANIAGNVNFSGISKVVEELKRKEHIDSISTLSLVDYMGTPLALMQYFNKGVLKNQLIDLEKSTLRKPLSESECKVLAQYSFKDKATVKEVTLLTEETVDSHHEYRKKPLPAYAVKLNHHTNTVVYVAPEMALVTSFRNDNWRAFDFLWMLHTMDYQSRDRITNWVLRIFSVLGILSISSGFCLFYLSSPTIRKWKKKIKY